LGVIWQVGGAISGPAQPAGIFTSGPQSAIDRNLPGKTAYIEKIMRQGPFSEQRPFFFHFRRRVSE
jgi:hypothetical protein